ncbi:hypothetical protein SDC9_107719 [bioreactor metagenome]|uniref:Uncharacterized protein n=1 Tax=bioreactor metagenome TaxID=1076179 RepID=A0A645B606_9ZZZZ
MACNTGLCEASVVRLLDKAGLQVLRRKWVPADEPGAAPALVLLTAPAADSAAAHAAQQLQQSLKATVRRLRVERP